MNDGYILLIFVLWILSSFTIGWIAAQRGWEGVAFGLLALVISPILTYLILISLPIKPVVGGNKTPCPHCHGLVDLGVKCCMYCTHDIYWSRNGNRLDASITPPIESPVINIPELLIVKAEPDPEVLIPKEKPSELFEAQCPDCGKNFPIQSNRGMIETLCPHCQSILQLDTAVG